VEVVAEESGASDESAFVALDLQVALVELDRYIGGGDVRVSASGQRCEAYDAVMIIPTYPFTPRALLCNSLDDMFGDESVVVIVRRCPTRHSVRLVSKCLLGVSRRGHA